MASAVYPKGIIAIMQADITGGLDAAAVRAILVDTAVYTYNATHQFYDPSLTAGGIVATETGALASKTIGVVGTGVFDAANATVTAATGTHAEACVVFYDSGTATTDTLLSYNELSSPVTPNGGDIVLSWHTDGIFSL
jgi:hypothetical protein